MFIDDNLLAADTYLTADSGIASSIPARSNTFVEIDHEVISTTIPPSISQEGLLSVTSESMCTKYWGVATYIQKCICVHIRTIIWEDSITILMDS